MGVFGSMSFPKAGGAFIPFDTLMDSADGAWLSFATGLRRGFACRISYHLLNLNHGSGDGVVGGREAMGGWVGRVKDGDCSWALGMGQKTGLQDKV